MTGISEISSRPFVGEPCAIGTIPGPIAMYRMRWRMNAKSRGIGRRPHAGSSPSVRSSSRIREGMREGMRDGEGRRGPGHLWAPGFCLARSPRQIPQKLPLVRVLPLLPVVRVRCSLVNLPYISIRVVVARFRTLQTVRRRAVDAPYSICPPSHLTTHAHSHVQKTNGASRVVSTMAKKSVGDLSKADLEGKVRVRLRSSPCLPLPVSLSPSPSVSLSLGND